MMSMVMCGVHVHLTQQESFVTLSWQHLVSQVFVRMVAHVKSYTMGMSLMCIATVQKTSQGISVRTSHQHLVHQVYVRMVVHVTMKDTPTVTALIAHQDSGVKLQRQWTVAPVHVTMEVHATTLLLDMSIVNAHHILQERGVKVLSQCLVIPAHVTMVVHATKKTTYTVTALTDL